MKKRKTKKASSGELELLSLLWRLGPLTIAEVHEAMERPIGYTTVQTRLNRLVENGLAAKSKQRPAKYSASVSADDVSANQLELLLDRVTEGNVVPLVAHLVDDRNLTRDEIGKLKKIIDDAERRLEEDNPQ